MNAKTAVAERTGNVADFAMPKGGQVALVSGAPIRGAYPQKIAKAIAEIKRRINPVAKEGEVAFGKGDNRTVQYRYPKSDDVLDEVLPLTAEFGLIITQNEVKQVLFENERTLAITYEYEISNEDGDVWPTRPHRTGMAWVRDKNGNVDDKASNKCSTQSEKYFYIKFFGIRTSDAAQLDNDAIVPERQIAEPTPAKPPRPGSAEAKKLDEPREINANGPKAWADAFIGVIERASTVEEIDGWCEANKGKLAKLEQHEAEHARATKALAARRAALRPKPPKPGAAASAPKVPPMPDPAWEPAEFIAWLKAKYETFETYDAGEFYWNNTIEALDLRGTVFEDAMAVWQAFEAKHAP